MDAMKRLAGIAPGGVFGLGEGVAEVLAAQAAVQQQQQQQQQQQNNGVGDPAKNAMQSLGQTSAYPFLKADSLYSAMPHISAAADPNSNMSRSQFYNPFVAANSTHIHQHESMFETLHHQGISNMMANHPSMSQLTSTMGSMAQQLNFADHMSQMMYQTHPSAYSTTTGQPMYAAAPSLSTLQQQWASNQQSASNPFVLANPRAAFGGSSASVGGESGSGGQQINSTGTSSGQGRGSHHASSSQQQHHHHHQAGASSSVGTGGQASSTSGLQLSGLGSSVSLAGLPTGISMPPGVSAATPDCDPRELEAFAERFKQRRIKLGVTQADVGVALGKLQIPGVGPLSQSTICRFESLTLSHNNMIALKPILEAWLDRAEKEMRERKENASEAGGSGKKRKRTSIPAPEKRSLEAYFQLQPRPSGEKIAQIADKLDLKKNVVRVWFCNQRQKQKRMKFATPGGPAISAPSSSAGSSRSSQN